MLPDYIDLRVRADFDVEELTGDLAETGLLGASEADGFAHFYWPSASWNPAVLDSFRHLLKKRGIAVETADLSVEAVPDQDWNIAWAQSVKPIRVLGGVQDHVQIAFRRAGWRDRHRREHGLHAGPARAIVQA